MSSASNVISRHPGTQTTVSQRNEARTFQQRMSPGGVDNASEAKPVKPKEDGPLKKLHDYATAQTQEVLKSSLSRDTAIKNIKSQIQNNGSTDDAKNAAIEGIRAAGQNRRLNDAQNAVINNIVQAISR